MTYTLEDYYKENSVKHKFLEYGAGAEYMVGYGEWLKNNHNREFEIFYTNNYGIDKAADKHLDIFRSYLDYNSMPIVLDVEMYSDKFKNIFCEDPKLTYHTLESIDKCIMDLFKEFGANPLSIATGQGYQYVLRVDKNKFEFDKLVDIGKGGLRSDVTNLYQNIPYNSKRKRQVDLKEGAAFNGTGKLMEWFSNEIIKRAPYYGVQLPVHISDIIPNNDSHMAVSLDISSFEAPINMRDFRCPFSTHQKMQVKPNGNPYTPIRIAIPRNIPDICDKLGHGFKLPLDDLFRLKENYYDAKNYANNVRMEIPEQAWALSKMIDTYKDSDLGEFHAAFDNASPDFDYNNMPGFHEFNPNFLDPNTFRKLAFELYDGEPSTAKQIAHYASIIGKENHWQEWNFNKYPADTKYDFWTRVYTGQLHTGMRFFDLEK